MNEKTSEKEPAIEVVVTVSEPYTVIAGGWTGMRPVGRRRDYAATYNGVAFKRTSKDEIGRLIRQAAYRNGERVKIIFEK